MASQRPDEICTLNRHMVGATGSGGIIIAMPPMGALTKEEAISLAAWLVMVADYGETERFNEILDAVRHSG